VTTDCAPDRRSPSTLSDGTLAFQFQRLAELPLAAVVVEARYSALFKLEHVNGNWLADQLARLQVRYPEVTIMFADSRRYAEDWTYRFLTTALADTIEPNQPEPLKRRSPGKSRRSRSASVESRFRSLHAHLRRWPRPVDESRALPQSINRCSQRLRGREPVREVRP
jgi:hypothetical protein